ncbi:hypothetical protein [Mesorhizobium sp. M0491]|uniref:hypothetical protein n=1 Tax=Mesorhizobium sp. M0491 TaxID=2956950 RepID=UPI00333DFBC8
MRNFTLLLSILMSIISVSLAQADETDVKIVGKPTPMDGEGLRGFYGKVRYGVATHLVQSTCETYDPKTAGYDVTVIWSDGHESDYHFQDANGRFALDESNAATVPRVFFQKTCMSSPKFKRYYR